MPSYLRFGLNGAHYAADAGAVVGIFWLPELTPDEEAPPHIAGIINLRGKIVPVMNLDLRFGHPSRRYRLTDILIVLQREGTMRGIVVNEVSDVIEIPETAIEPRPGYEETMAGRALFSAEAAKIGDEIVMLLDVSCLLHAPIESCAPSKTDELAYFCPEATAEQREVFHTRAHHLMQGIETFEIAELTPLSVIQLGDEWFGVELDAVREFSHLSRITPIPCCPPHIAGDMNLRGDILTLVDIRPLLKIPQEGIAAEVMDIESQDLLVGILVSG
ncbi:MAG: chemotaxis protein CheW, partial [Methylococcaceae bacterium]|nr:chemotaxis protein CheW [Methylococcaceae bacterium]